MREQVNELNPQAITSEVFLVSPSQLDYIADVFSKNFADAMNMRTMAGRIEQIAKESLSAAFKAARRMGGNDGRASNALCLFLVINSSSVQLLPATVIALRAAEGSANPGSITLPALAATTISTAVGVIACKIAEARPWG